MERENERDSDDSDEERKEQEALKRGAREGEGLIGDTNENRNLSGSSTWETLPDQGPDEEEEEELPGR